MGRRRSPATAIAVVLLGLIAARPAAAQSSEPLQLAVGYQLVHVSFDGTGETFPTGFYVDLGRTLKSDEKKAWGWIGRFEAGFRNADGFNEQLYSALGGIRLASTKPLKWTPSGHGLIGLGRRNASCDEFCTGADNGMTFQAGFFLSTPIDDKIAATVGFTATKMRVPSGGVFNAAVSGGIRVDLGR